MMKKLVVGIGALFVSTSLAFAEAPKPPEHVTGNFRRTEAINAAGAKHWTTATVHNVASSEKKIAGVVTPKDSRVMMVAHDGGKVDLVKVPLDDTKPVTKMTTRAANHLGLQTQSQARDAASMNGGKFGSKRPVTMQNDGIGARRNSYSFKQTDPSSKVVKEWGHVYRESGIQRTVTVTGSGESATWTKSEQLDKPAK
jgi:hypothetical protein